MSTKINVDGWKYDQQGDVLMFIIPKGFKLPEGSVKARRENAILAYGEATGHCHEARGSGTIALFDTEGLELDGVTDLALLETSEQTEVTHQEHGSITLTPGRRLIRPVQEFNHFKEEAQAVRD
jgi:hypothetical protein